MIRSLSHDSSEVDHVARSHDLPYTPKPARLAWSNTLRHGSCLQWPGMGRHSDAASASRRLYRLV